jgi:N-methylhydantoinase A
MERALDDVPHNEIQRDRPAMSDRARRIGVDIGGTFTDVAAVDAEGRLHIGKRLTTHGQEADGVIAAVGDTSLDLSAEDLIVAHGTTLIINAVLERRGSKAALVTTEGFADVLDIARSTRTEGFTLRYRRNPPLIPRESRFEIRERTHASGEVAHQPTPDELTQLVEQLREAGVEAVAVAFLNSYVEPANELAVAEAIRRELDIPVTTSSELSRQWREYERFSTAAANAYVAPVAARYLHRLVEGLAADGFNGQFVILDSSGGAMTTDVARRFPVRAVESGPVAGVIGARSLAESLGLRNLVVFDMGGTTSKVALVEAGDYATTDLYWIGGRERGFPLQVNSVDVIEVPVGGGSIAWFDSDGRLRVGPKSAGSQPGPACYGLGGLQPTVTDANLFCGRMDKEHFVGEVELDTDAAAAAIGRLAVEAGIEPERLALGIIQLANMQIAGAVRRQTLERGRDPAEFALLATGGAGPVHGCEVAVEAGIRDALIPRYAGHYSALGMLRANLRLDRREIMLGLLADLDIRELEKVIDRVSGDLAEQLRFQAPPAAIDVRYSLGLRYHGQEHIVRIPAGIGTTVPPTLSKDVREAFEIEYIRRYGHLDPHSAIEVVEVEVMAERPLPPVITREVRDGAGSRDEIQSRWRQGEPPVRTAALSRGTLSEGDSLEGPAVIYEEGSTAVIPPGAFATIVGDSTIRVDLSQLMPDRS